MGPVTQEDPIGIVGGLNLYGYANGDPINFSDPFGLCRKENGNEDPECVSLIRIMQRVADAEGTSAGLRGELLNTIERYRSDDFDLDVQLLHGLPGGRMGSFRPNNYIRIDLSARNDSDIALAGWHEMEHYRFFEGGVRDTNLQHRIIYPQQMRLYGGLSPAGKAEAVRTKAILISQGYWR